ncbi:UNVERIFIED_CONTAM: hypothetical protein FKN15_023767 [Acipenser sinensis]
MEILSVSGFHHCMTCQAKLPASDPHNDFVTCLGPEHAASALADRAFCHLCAGFQTSTLRQRVKNAVGGHFPSSGSSHTISAPPSSTATPPGRLQLSRSLSSQLAAGQRSPTRRAREHGPSPRRVRPVGSLGRSPDRLVGEDALAPLVGTGDTETANVVPRVPEQPIGPIASQPVAPPQPALVVAPPVQAQGAWDVDAVSRDTSDVLEGESIAAEVASQHSEPDIELEVLDTDDPTWSVVERATRHLGIEWPMAELPWHSFFESPSAQPHQSRMLPAFPDFVKEVQSTLGAPASAPATSRKASAFSMQGANDLSYTTLITWKEFQSCMPWEIALLVGGGFALAQGTEAEAINVNPLYILIPTTLCTSFAFLLPVANPPNAIVFTYGHLQVIDMVKAGLGVNIIGVLAVMLGVRVWGVPLFDLETYPSWAPPHFSANITGP